MTDIPETGSNSAMGGPPPSGPPLAPPPPDAKPPQWYEHIAVIILGCLCCWPIGVVLVWVKRQWPTKTKAIITGVLVAIALIFVVISAVSGGTKTDSGAVKVTTAIGPASTTSTVKSSTSTTVAPSTTAAPTTAAPTTTVVPTIEGFPLPPRAVLISGPTEKRSPVTGFLSTQAIYSVADMSSAELRSWYERNPIYRAPFGQYKWCESFVDGGTWDMWWRIDSTKTAIGVNSLASSATAKGVTFSVSKETGETTSCR